jgi:peptide/nickel transport system substrate-binding protein
MRRLLTLGAVVAAGLLAAACGASSPSSSSSAPSGALTISNESGGLWTCGFNPFNGDVSFLSVGNVYEPLAFVNTLESGKTTPWLATSWAWGNGNKTLTFTIRKGVKFSNGTPLTAADVAGTFNLLNKFPGLDLNSIWSGLGGPLTAVTAKGDQVVMSFKSGAVPYFYYIADQTPIVPMSIWSKLKNPVSYDDSSPVATGAYTVSKCTGENITYTANKHYWQKGEPKVATVLYPAFTSNDPANQYLADGQAQWGSQFIPDIQKFYLDKSSDYHDWFPPVANVSLFINLKDPLLNNVAVRQAMAYAIDRPKVSQVGEYGYEPASNQTGIVTPTFSSWMDSSQAAAYGYGYNPAKAKSILEKAGFKLGSNGIFTSKSGQPLSFSVVNEGGYSDWVADMQVIQSDFSAVGIKLTPLNLSSTDYDTRIDEGDFQLAYDAETGGPTPYYELRQWLYSGNTAPIGKVASSNFERYSNPATDKLLDEYGATTSTATQHSIVDQLQKVLLTDVPVIPVVEEVDWFQYDTGAFSGWPTRSNPYAQPAAYDNPDMGIVLLHLRPKS